MYGHMICACIMPMDAVHLHFAARYQNVGKNNKLKVANTIYKICDSLNIWK